MRQTIVLVYLEKLCIALATKRYPKLICSLLTILHQPVVTDMTKATFKRPRKRRVRPSTGSEQVQKSFNTSYLFNSTDGGSDELTGHTSAWSDEDQNIYQDMVANVVAEEELCRVRKKRSRSFDTISDESKRQKKQISDVDIDFIDEIEESLEIKSEIGPEFPVALERRLMPFAPRKRRHKRNRPNFIPTGPNFFELLPKELIEYIFIFLPVYIL